MSLASAITGRFAKARFPGAAFAKPVERRYHHHMPGIVFVGFTIIVALGAVNSQNNLLFLALGLCLGALVISGVISGTSLLGVRLRREIPASSTCLRPVDITYQVTNANRWFTSLGLVVEEVLPPTLRARRSSGVAWWKFRLVTGTATTTRPRAPAAFIPSVPPRSAITVRARVTPLRRGWLRLPSVRVWTTFPFGLSRKSIRFDQESFVLVRPGVLELKPGILQGLLTHGPDGERASGRLGTGDEFYGIREYVPGDSPRRVAWRSSARRASAGGSLVIRQNLAPAPPMFWVVLRLDSGVGEAANERAILLAASLLAAIADAHAAVGVFVLNARVDGREAGSVPTDAGAGILGRGDDVLRAEPRSGGAHLAHMLTQLAMARSTSPSDRVAPALSGGLVVAIHAGVIEARAVPFAARHWSGDDLAKLIDPNRAAAALALLERSFEPGEGAFA
jgi:uncharacterized protein (DUF58 family)